MVSFYRELAVLTHKLLPCVILKTCSWLSMLGFAHNGISEGFKGCALTFFDFDYVPPLLVCDFLKCDLMIV